MKLCLIEFAFFQTKLLKLFYQVKIWLLVCLMVAKVENQVVLGTIMLIMDFVLEDLMDQRIAVNPTPSNLVESAANTNLFHLLLNVLLNANLVTPKVSTQTFISEIKYIILILMYLIFKEKLWLMAPSKPLWPFIKISWPINQESINMLQENT